MSKFWFWKREPKPETVGEKAERLRKALVFDPELCEYKITREYLDAVIDEIMAQ